jgi:iron complex transport system substrate-binding protein
MKREKMMYRTLQDPKILIIRLVTLLLVLAACTPKTPSPPTATSPNTPTSESEPLILTDGLDRALVFYEPFQRIISFAPSNTEILFAVGAGSQVVGREEFSDYPPEASQIQSIGSLYGDLNTEAIVALEPDLVLAAEITSPEQIQAVNDLGIPVFALPNPVDFSGLYTNIETVGLLTGHETEASTLIQSLRDRVNAVTEAVTDAEPISVYYEVDGTDPNAPWTAGAGTFHDLLINMAGGRNITADLELWVQVSVEEIIAKDPRVMIFAAAPWIPTTAASVAERPGWGEITAIAEGAVYPIDSNWTDRPGPRLVDALEAVARKIHPEQFDQ